MNRRGVSVRTLAVRLGQWALDTLQCTLGVALVLTNFALARLAGLLLAPFMLLFTGCGVARIFRRFPRTTLAVSSAVAFFGCSAGSGPRLFDHPTSWPFLAGAYLASISAYYISATTLLSFPPTLKGIQAESERCWPERWYARRLAHPIDAFFVRVIMRNTAITAPAFLAVILPSTCSLFSAAGYLLAISITGRAQESLDHGNIHNNLFRFSHTQNRLDRLILRCTAAYHNYILNPMSGRIPNWYKITHIAVHHVENSGPDDFQATRHYDRTSFFDFCRLGARLTFTATIGADALLYLIRRKRFKAARELTRAMLLYYLALASLAAFNWPGALVLVGARLLAGPGGAATTFRWHGLVDMDDPNNIFRNTITVGSGVDEHGSFGLIFHIEHHLHPQRHWSHYAADARANAARYRDEGSITLNLGRTSFLGSLWRRRFDDLAACVVDGGDRAEVARMLEARTRPLMRRPRTRLGRAIDDALGRIVAVTLL